MNPQELTGVALDFAVAQTLNLEVAVDDNHVYLLSHPKPGVTTKTIYSPSTRWEHGGPIIEHEEIELTRTLLNRAWAAHSKEMGHGPTLLIAAMRCFVASNS